MTKPKANQTSFKPGQSGNPAGRTPGYGEVAKLRKSIADHIPDIITALVTQSKAGDVGASRLLLERVFPAVKPVEQPQAINLPGDTLTERGRAVLDAIASGELAPGNGAQLLAAIGTLAKVSELDELAARVAALEKTKESTDGNA